MPGKFLDSFWAGKMEALELFKKIEEEIPKELALKDDFVGFIGKSINLKFDIERVLILMDYIPSFNDINYSDYDLLILHHLLLTILKI